MKWFSARLKVSEPIAADLADFGGIAIEVTTGQGFGVAQARGLVDSSLKWLQYPKLR